MSEDSHDDDTVVVQEDVGETVHVEEAEKKEERQQQNQEQMAEEEEELQADQELKQRVISRQEEKGKGQLSAAKEVTDSKLIPSQQQQRKGTKNATSATSKQREQQPNLYNLSKQLESHTRQLSRIGSIVEQLPKYLKNADTQSKIIRQINSSMNQLQKQVDRIQKSVQKKGKQR